MSQEFYDAVEKYVTNCSFCKKFIKNKCSHRYKIKILDLIEDNKSIFVRKIGGCERYIKKGYFTKLVSNFYTETKRNL